MLNSFSKKVSFFGFFVIVILLQNCVEIKSGKILANLPSVELADYRFGLGDPYVVLYQKENYKGGVHFQKISRKCTDVEDNHMKWASSVDLQRRCVTVCEEKGCSGYCRRLLPDNPPKSERGVARLQDYDFNDRIASIKFCY